MPERRNYRIYISAGHGYYYHTSYNKWLPQRRSYWGVIEDFWNALVARELFTLLDEDPRFSLFMNRDFFNEELGLSGHPKWMEASHLFFKEIGAPESIWNVGTGIKQAVNADALGTKFYQADIALSLHANSGGGEARGHEVWHHTQANLGRKLAAQLDSSLAGLPNPSRGLKTDYHHDQYAFWRETRGKIMSLVEFFFFDNEEDNELMQKPSNITLCAQLMYQGIVNFIEIFGHSIPWIASGVTEDE